MNVYIVRVDTAGGTTTKAFSNGGSLDYWLEGFLTRAYKLHWQPPWPAIVEGRNTFARIQFLLEKLDWYTVEYTVCGVTE